MKSCLFHIKLRLTKDDNTCTPIDMDQDVSLCNLPLHTLFSQVEVAFQQIPLGHSGANYPYKVYIDTILKTSTSQQKGVLTSQLFYKDTSNHDITNSKTGQNTGLFSRSWFTDGGLIVDLEGPLQLDLFQQPRLLINGKVQVGKDQEKAQSERDSHSKNRGGKKPN